MPKREWEYNNRGVPCRKPSEGPTKYTFDLQHGDVLIMAWHVQTHWVHSVPQRGGGPTLHSVVPPGRSEAASEGGAGHDGADQPDVPDGGYVMVNVLSMVPYVSGK
jgi:hypothetical protein